MARRARLSASRDVQVAWPWHTAKAISLPASALWGGERRLEAENYLSGGYGQRLALSARLAERTLLGDLARVWQPSRLKGTVVLEDVGTPFLAATQVFDLRPIPRKFLAIEKTDNTALRFVAPGTILVTCSGTVGRATLATEAMSKTLISHDLLRITPTDSDYAGWLYAYLRAPSVRQMMSSAQYGHIIKHLEPSHLSTLPMPRPRQEVAHKFNAAVAKILVNRNEAERKIRAAETLFADAIGTPISDVDPVPGFSISSASFGGGRRRFEAVFHNPSVRKLQHHFKSAGFRTVRLDDIGFSIWLPNRFKRVPAEEGFDLIGSSDLFEINPDIKKRIVDIKPTNGDDGRVKRGWLLLARSGQTYGLNGTFAIANSFHENKIVSDHVIRIAPAVDCTARAGYIYTALSHPTLGRPLVKALAYGSSIPEIEVADVAALRVVRLETSLENRIADLAEEGSRMFAEADILEEQLGSEAGELIEQLIAGDWSNFVAFPD